MSNLDDFFKKRDKKKKSAKSKFPTLDTDELVKNLEATAIKAEDEVDYQDDNNNFTSSTNTNVALNDNLDEEWKPYEDENKDLSGLKITFLKQVEDENNDYLGVIDENEKKSACPWGAVQAQNKFDENEQNDNDLVNEPLTVKQTALSDSTNQLTNTDIQKSAQQTAAETASESTSKSETTSSSGAYVPPSLRRAQPAETKPVPVTTTESTASKYIPPSMRGRQAESSSSSSGSAIPTTSVNYRRPNKSQPNIMDTMEFPTLDAAGTESTTTTNTSSGTGEKFEMAKKGARIEPKSEGNMINLANKFTALSSNN